MKDPLDARDDPYQVLNDEAERQGKRQRVTSCSRQKEIQRLASQLRPRSREPQRLTEARDRLALVERRLLVDILQYWQFWVADTDPAAPPLGAAAAHLGSETPSGGGSIPLVTGKEDALVPMADARPDTFSPLTGYDEALRWDAPLDFEESPIGKKLGGT